MKIVKKVAILFTIATIILSCSASSKFFSKAEKYEKAGLYEEAADYYYKAVDADRENLKAVVHLKRLAPKVLDEKIEEFNKLFTYKEYDEAYKKFKLAKYYEEKINDVGVNIKISGSDVGKFKKTEKILAERHYKKGLAAFNQKSWTASINSFKQALKYVKNYKDSQKYIRNAKDILNTELAEEEYQRAKRNFNSGNYKSAYYAFGKCLSYKSYYKDASDLRRESLEKGKIRIGIFQFKNDTRLYNVHNKLYSYVLSKAVNYKSPFIEVVDRDNLKRLLNEQRLGMSGIIDESSAAQAGKVLGLNAVVLGRLVDARAEVGDIKSTPVDAFEPYRVKVGKKTKTKGKKVKFYVYEGKTSVIYKAQFQIIDTETSRILNSDIVSSSANDHVKYATYRGDYSNLTLWDPALRGWGAAGAAFVGDIDKTLFKARRNLKEPGDMAGEIVEDLAEQMANKICGFFD